jgi:hypothetical protein
VSSNIFFKKLSPKAPHQQMKSELQAIKGLSQSQPEGTLNLEGGKLVYKGLKSVCLYGWAPEKTLPSKYYTEDQGKEKSWLFEKKCPITVSFLKKLLHSIEYDRARVQFLRPGGILEPHKDNQDDNLSVLVINVCHPHGCTFTYHDEEINVPIEDGDVYLINPGRFHSVTNEGNEDRISIVLSGDFSPLLDG